MKNMKQKMIIVGNGSDKRKLGQTIDSFDLVVRFNKCVIKGYEEYIGTKTNIVVGVKNKSDFYKNIDTILLVHPIELDKYTKIYKEKIICIEDDIFKSCVEKYTDPSSGIIAVEYFIKKNKYDITLTRFDGFKTPHYYEKNTTPWEKNVHKEFETLKEYEKKGILKFL